MRSRKFVFICLPVLASACGTSGNGAPQQSSGSASGAGAQSGSSASGNPSSGASTGDTSASGSGASTGGGGSGISSGGSTGSASGATSGASSGAGGYDGGSIDAAPLTLPDGAVNMVPAGYTGTPFATNTIPGFIYAANYDKGGPSVAYCHIATGTAATCAGAIHLNDWCCSDCNATMTGARCDDRSQNLGACPIYRPDSDNAGLSHMNLGEVDTYANAGPTWVPGPNGPTLTGPTVTVGTPVPQHASMTTQDDTYIGYMATGEWSKYTVQVLAAGTYSIGGLLGVPPGTKITLDFGNGVTSGMIALPASPVTPACKCIEAYHAWTNMSNVGMVTFPAAGTYLMTFTLNALQFNPLYFTFTKM